MRGSLLLLLALAGCEPELAGSIPVAPGFGATVSASEGPLVGALELELGAELCALAEGGSISCWHQAGDPRRAPGSQQAGWDLVLGLGSVRTFDLWESHGCAVIEQGGVLCWSDDTSEQLHDETARRSPITVNVIGIGDALDVSVGRDVSCAMLVSGEVACWATGSTMPLTRPDLGGVIRLAVADHACAVLKNGTVSCFGGVAERGAASDAADAGHGTDAGNEPQVAIVAGIDTALEVAVSDGYSCVVLANGFVACWGDNSFGRLGRSDVTASPLPSVVSGIAGATEIVTAETHACALIAEGRVACWGDNSEGQLGDGTRVSSTSPVRVDGVAAGIGLTSHGRQTCVLRENGTIHCWGSGAQDPSATGL